MATSVLIRRINSLNVLNLTKKGSQLLIDTKRTNITKNEKDWIKEESKKLIEQAKNEKGPNLNIDLKQPQLYFDKSEELKTADERIKKIFSLEFAHRDDYKKYEEELLKKIFQKSPIEQDSLEIQIALHTLTIRRLCNNMKESNGKNRRVEFLLYRAIHRRNRLLVQLFYRDNKRYEWVKEQLNLKNDHLVESYPYRRVTRYEKFVNEVKAEADRQRTLKLNKLNEEYEQEMKTFFKEKEEALAKIRKEIKELGFDLKFPESDSTPVPNTK